MAAEPQESTGQLDSPLDVILSELVDTMENVRELLANAATVLRHLDHGGSLGFVIQQLEEHAETVHKRLGTDRK